MAHHQIALQFLGGFGRNGDIAKRTEAGSDAVERTVDIGDFVVEEFAASRNAML